jgi:hypothetical protein
MTGDNTKYKSGRHSQCSRGINSLKRSEGVGIASIIVGLIVLALLLLYLFVPIGAYYVLTTLIGVGSIVSVIFMAIGMLGKE